MVDSTKTYMQADEYLQLPMTAQPMALIDGEVIMSPSPVPAHQRTSTKFVILLHEIIPHGEVFHAPMDVYFDDTNVTQPDVLWIADDGKCIVGEKYLRGAPDLIIEILSPGTARDDKIKKFKLYERFGVREYWIADPIEQYVEVYVLFDERYRLEGIYAPDDTFISEVLGQKKVKLVKVFDA